MMAIERLNPLMEREFASYSQMKGARIYTPPTNSTKGFNKSMKHNAQIFQHVSLQERLNPKWHANYEVPQVNPTLT
jgi:hypothetical protein